MGSRISSYLLLRFLHRSSPRSHLPPLLAKPYSFIHSFVACQGSPICSGEAPSPLLSFAALNDAAPLAPHVFCARPALSPSQIVWGSRVGFALNSGLYLPAHHEEEGMETSSVKRKRKKKMNKHKQRKLRRRDRHRN